MVEGGSTVKLIDLRSDTVTQPTPAMRDAMYRAEVGDDGYGEDPTINRLEAMAAEAMGKEAAMFCASGTMSNLVAVLTHCRRGDEVIVGSESHILFNEVAGSSALGGVQLRVVPNGAAGRLDPAAVEAVVRPDYIAFPPTGLLCLENTHNRCCGAVLTIDYMRTMGELAASHGIPIHLDGARIFNAAVYLGVPVAQLAAEATSVSFCLSKGLAAPVGSLLCGSAEYVARARRNRRMVGGGMRQAGILAAAGIVAIETMIDRLAEDHANAKRLAAGLANVPGIAIDAAAVQTNIVVFDYEGRDPAAFVDGLRREGVLLSSFGPRRFRMVTHHGIAAADIEAALAAVALCASGARVVAET